MARGMLKRYLSICLVAVMLLTTLLPVRVFAADEAGFDDANTNYEDPADTELEEPSFTLDEPEPEAEPESDDTADEPVLPEVSDYASFLSCFKVLEGYAQTYAEENAGEDASALIINYIRTGVERYTSGTWEMVCGKENTAFTAYVSEQDAANGTSASALKRIQNFTLPNGDPADLGHVFGAMVYIVLDGRKSGRNQRETGTCDQKDRRDTGAFRDTKSFSGVWNLSYNGFG